MVPNGSQWLQMAPNGVELHGFGSATNGATISILYYEQKAACHHELLR